VAKPVEGWCSVNTGQILGILGTMLSAPKRPAKEEPSKEDKKEEKKEEPKSEPEKKRSGGVVGSASKRADGCAQRGKTRGKMV
jgi:hypothetical protein